MKFFKKLTKRSQMILIFSAAAIIVTAIAAGYLNTSRGQKETYTVKNYENMTENKIANEVREYMKVYSDMDAKNIDAVTEVAVKDYNTVLNSGIDSVTTEHSGAIEESIKDTLLSLLPNTDTDLSDEEIEYLSNGICQIIWNALLDTINSNDTMLSQKYEEQYIAFTTSLQEQIDELAERSTEISITANIKPREEGINASDLENAKSDIYSELCSELDSLKTEIRDDVMENVSNGKDGRDGRDGSNGKDGKDGIDGKDGSNGKDGKDGINGKDGSNGKDGLDGKDGEDGINGANGLDGEDGTDAYMYVRYAEDIYGSGMSEQPNDKSLYIGVYSGDSSIAPNYANAYTWSRFKGNDGSNGQDGNDGKDGQDGKDGNDGKDGQDGTNGTAAYMYVRYAEDIAGAGMSEQPNDKTYYIGIYSGDDPIAPDTADAYIWSKYRGNDSASATYDADTNTVILTITK